MYFDNAATTWPKPEAVYRRMDEFFRTSGANPGRSAHGMAVAAEVAVARARGRLAQFLNAPRPERLIWTLNGTDGNNLALKGFLRPGDRVVTTGLEHNAVVRPLRSLERHGVELVRVPCPGGTFDLSSFLEAIHPGTRLVAMVHASNVTGEVLPVEEVGTVCRRRGIPLLIDAAQSAGVLPLDVRELGPERVMVAMPGHKGLLGPTGIGALYIGEELELQPLKEGGTGSTSEREEQPEELPYRFESGTLNTVGIAGLGAALEWLLQTGREAIHQHEATLVRRLWSGLSEVPGVRLYGPPPGPRRASLVSFDLEGWEPSDAAQVLDQSFDIQCRPGLHCAPWAHQSLGTFPAGTIRLSPGFFNTETEVEAAVRAVRGMLSP